MNFNYSSHPQKRKLIFKKTAGVCYIISKWIFFGFVAKCEIKKPKLYVKQIITVFMGEAIGSKLEPFNALFYEA